MTINYGTGVMVITHGTEIMDLTPASTRVQLDKLFLSDDSEDRSVPLIGARTEELDSPDLTIIMTETQRIAALVSSGTPGGDETAVTMDTDEGLTRDIAQNLLPSLVSITITETPDTIVPIVTSALLNLNDGILYFYTSETIHANPTTNVDLTQCVLENNQNDGHLPTHDPSGRGITEIVQADAVNVTLRLTLLQRAEAIRISGTSGGDGGALTINLGAAFARDMAGNTNPITSTVSVEEIPDTTRPILLRASVNYSTGIILMYTDEIMELTNAGTIDSTHLYLVDLSEEYGGSNHASLTFYDGSGTAGVYQTRVHNGVHLGGNTQVTGDDQILQIQLTETQRIQSLVLSGTSGGDGIALNLSVAEDAFSDLAGNKIIPVDVVLEEIPDTIRPRIIAARIDLTSGILSLDFSETIDITPTSLLVLSNIKIANITGDRDVIVGGGGTGGTTGRSIGNFPDSIASAVEAIAEGLTINIILTEAQRVRCIEISGTQGGDGVAAVLDADLGAVVDMAGNPSEPNYDFAIIETGDISLPTITSAEIFLGTGVLQVTASETIDVTPTDLVNQTGLVVDNYGNPISGLPRWIRLWDAQVSSGKKDGLTFTVQMTEAQRVHAIALSNTPGGDGMATVFDVDQNAVRDMAGNFVLEDSNNPMTEHADSIVPIVDSARINYSTGIIVVRASETIDSTPSNLIDVDQIFMVNQSASYPSMVSLTGANIVSSDAIFATLTLTEAQRVSAIAMSGTPGGDGIPNVMTFMASALRDIATNPIVETHDIVVNETSDTIHPTSVSATLDYSDGKLILTASETIDSTPIELVHPNLFFILNDNTVATTSNRVVNIQFAEVTSSDSLQLTLTLTEEDRVKALEISNTPGGDGTGAVLLETQVGAYFDIGENANDHGQELTVVETADTVRPELVQAWLDLNNGTLRAFFSETIDTTPASDKVVPASFRLMDVGGDDDALLLSGASVREYDSVVVTLGMTEIQRVQCIERSNTPGGDGTPLHLRLQYGAVFDIGTNPSVPTYQTGGDLLISETADTTPPTLVSVRLELGMGEIVFEFSETIDSTPNTQVNGTDVVFRNADNEHEILRLIGTEIHAQDTVQVTMTMNEARRVSCIENSGQPGGDGAAMFMYATSEFVVDIAGVGLTPIETGFVLEEIPDTILPSVLYGEINFDSGIMILIQSETVDSTPSSSVVLDNYAYLLSGTPSVQLAGATTKAFDSYNFTITLTERQRIDAIQISGTPGGVGSPITLRVLPNSFRDIAQNRNPNQQDIVLVETPDTTPPIPLNARINYGTGVLMFNTSEILDVTPTSNVALNLMSIRDDAVTELSLDRQNGYVTSDVESLTGGTITAYDDMRTILSLTELQRVHAIAFSNTNGGDGATAAWFVLEINAILDVGTNRNSARYALQLVEEGDAIPPNLNTATINYGTGIIVITTDETIDVTPYTSKVDLSKIRVNHVQAAVVSDNNPGNNGVYVSTGIEGASVVEEDAQTLTLHLNEIARVSALLTSATPGGDGDTNYLDVAQGGFVDIGQNPTVVASLVLSEIADTIAPTLFSGRVNLSNGVVVIEGSETLDIRSSINTTGIYFADVSGARSVHLQGCQIHLQTARDFSYDFTLTLTERQRVALIAISNTPGGDGDVSVLDIHTKSVVDMAGNVNIDSFGLVVNETADAVRPRLISAAIHYGVGTIILGFSETINYSTLNLDHGLLVNGNGGDGTTLPLSSSTILPQHLTPNYNEQTNSRHHVVFVLDELTRSLAVAMSSTSGGDSNTLTLRLSDLFIQDMAVNNVIPVESFDFVETADTLRPVVSSAFLNYSTGLLRIITNETLDITPSSLKVDLTGFTLHNDVSSSVVSLEGASVRDVDDVSFEITLTEQQRSEAIAFSNVPGGDGTVAKLSITAGSVVDIAQNKNVEVVGISLSEAPDTKYPQLVRIDLDLSNGKIWIEWDEIMDLTPTTNNVVASLMSLVNGSRPPTSYDGDNIIFPSNMEVTSSVDGYYVNVTLNERHRIRAIEYSGTIGGDGTANNFRCQRGCVHDVGENKNDDRTFVAYEHPDIVRPFLTHAFIDYNNGYFIVNTSERINLEYERRGRVVAPPVVDPSRLVISNVSGVATFDLTSAAPLLVEDGTSAVYHLTEVHRVIAMMRSGTSTGGDFHPIVLDVLSNAFFDVAHNGNIENLNFSVIEVADTTPPVLIHAEIHLTDGLLLLKFNEVMELASDVSVDRTKVYLKNADGDRFALGSDIHGLPSSFVLGHVMSDLFVHGQTINISLTEEMRVASIARSSTAGGDGFVLTIEIDSSAVKDVSGNGNLAVSNNILIEYSDISRPSIVEATVNYSTGFVEFRSDETMDVTPLSLINTTKFVLMNGLNEVVIDLRRGIPKLATDHVNPSVPSADYAQTRDGDTLRVGIQLDEDDRILALLASGQPGGLNIGNGPLRVHALESAYRDIGLNPSLEVPVLAFNEYPDTIRPFPTQVIIEYDIGKVVLRFSEYIDVTPQSTMSTHNIYVANHTDGTDLPLVNLVNFQEVDGLNVTLYLNEVYRNNGLRMSGVKGGDGHTAFMNFGLGSFQDIAGNLNARWTSIAMTEIPDTRPPEIIGSELFYGSGLLFIHFSETIDVTPTSNVNVSGFFISNETTLSERGTIHVEGGRVTTPISDNSTFSITLTEAQRAQAVRMSGTPGGDIGNIILDVVAGTVFDLAGNPNVLFFHVVILEHEDDIPPVILSSLLNLSTGYLIIRSSETMDVTPTSLDPLPPLNASRIALVNNQFNTLAMNQDLQNPGSSNDLINLQGAEYIYCDGYAWDCDGVDVTIVLTEYQRSRAIAMSATPGGDGTGMTLSLLENAMRDIALNFQNTTHNVAVNETADTIRPNALTASLNYSDGTLTVTTSETIDLTPVSLVKPQLISLLNDNTVATTSNRVQDIRAAEVLTNTDGLTFSLRLTEYERIRALEISGTPGGDGSAVLLETSLGAFFDIGQNPCNPNMGIVVTEYLDSVRPSLTQAWLDLNNGTLRVFFDETIDSTPTSLVTPESFLLVNNGGDVSTHTSDLALSSSEVLPAGKYMF